METHEGTRPCGHLEDVDVPAGSTKDTVFLAQVLVLRANKISCTAMHSIQFLESVYMCVVSE